MHDVVVSTGNNSLLDVEAPCLLTELCTSQVVLMADSYRLPETAEMQDCTVTAAFRLFSSSGGSVSAGGGARLRSAPGRGAEDADINSCPFFSASRLW